MRLTVFLLLFACFCVSHVVAQTETPKSFESYNKLFDHFQERREALFTKLRRAESEKAGKERMQELDSELRELDESYVDALKTYIDDHPGSDDLAAARFERVVSLSRLPNRFDDTLAACADFLTNHVDHELAGDVRFIRVQVLFRSAGKESEAIKQIEDFLKRYPKRPDSDAVRMMRVRTLLFLDRVEDARGVLRNLLEQDRVRKDKDAKANLQRQLDNLDWVGRKITDFTLAKIGEGKITRDDLLGKPAVLFVWDSTSEVCRAELSYVQQSHAAADEKYRVVGISVNESKPALEQWLKKNPKAATFDQTWVDRDMEGTLVRKLNLSMIPFNVLLDAQGKVYRYDVRSDDLLRYAGQWAKADK